MCIDIVDEVLQKHANEMSKNNKGYNMNKDVLSEWSDEKKMSLSSIESIVL